MGSNLAGFSYIYNAVKFDIPFVESIKSVIDVVDAFVLTECYSEDETWDLCLKLHDEYPDKIKLMQHPWVKHFTEISKLANWTMNWIKPGIRYAMELQSDEVVHENDLHKLYEVPIIMKSTHRYAASWNYYYFVASPEIIFPFVYSTVIRIVDRQSSWKVVNDGVSCAPTEPLESAVLMTDIDIFHYGKMKAPDKAFAKEVDFQNLFKDIGFPDPRMQEMKEKLGTEYCDYLFLFQEALKQGKMSRFTGTHPKVMLGRIKQFKDMGWEQLQSLIDKELKMSSL